MSYVAVCSDANASTSCVTNGDGSQTCTVACSSIEWDSVPGLLPPLSIENGLSIALAIGVLWAVAFGFRFIRRYLSR